MTLVTRKRVLAAKVETTIGTAISISATDAAFNVNDLKMDPVITFDEREGQAGFSHRTGTLGARMGRCTFWTDLVGGATIPALWATFMPACGFVDTADVFAPVSAPPTASGGVKTLTMGCYIDGIKKALRGAMGNCRIEFTAGQPARMFWDFMGIWETVADVPILAPDYPDYSPLRFASSALAIDSAGTPYTPRVSKLTLDFGNQVQMLEDSTDVSGYRHAIIVGRRVNGTMDPEAELVATRDWYGLWLSLTEKSLSWTLGTTGNQVQFALPKVQHRNIQESDRNKVYAEQIEWQANRSADAGDDELTLTVK